jgi:hypothetical protein
MPREDATQHVLYMRIKLHTGFILGEIATICHEIVWVPVWTVRRRENFLVGAGYRNPILWLSDL